MQPVVVLQTLDLTRWTFISYLVANALSAYYTTYYIGIDTDTVGFIISLQSTHYRSFEGWFYRRRSSEGPLLVNQLNLTRWTFISDIVAIALLTCYTTFVHICNFVILYFLSASLYFSKRGAYWDRLCRDVVGRWLVVTRVHCGQTVHPRLIVTNYRNPYPRNSMVQISTPWGDP